MTISSKPLIVGVSGTFASGQDSVAHYLCDKHNFLFNSTSDMVREEAMKRYGSIERPILARTATELRQEKGGGVLCELALQKFRQDSNRHAGVVVSGIRSLGEEKTIKEAGGVMVFTDAPLEIRYERMRARKRDSEVEVSLDEFKQREAAEAHAGNLDSDFNRDAIRDHADYIITNESSLEDFYQKVEAVYQRIDNNLK